MPVRKTLAVTAASGRTGRLVVIELLCRAQNACVVAMVRNTTAVQALAAPG